MRFSFLPHVPHNHSRAEESSSGNVLVSDGAKYVSDRRLAAPESSRHLKTGSRQAEENMARKRANQRRGMETAYPANMSNRVCCICSRNIEDALFFLNPFSIERKNNFPSNKKLN
jgi:hypothetical protein